MNCFDIPESGVYCADKVTIYSFSLKLRGLESKNDFNQGSLSKLRYKLLISMLK